jgi:hypothetical protein
MLQKFKITTCAFILCLFGLTLMTVTPVFAADSAAFKQCQQIKPQGKFEPMKQKKNCFKDLAGPRSSAEFGECQKIKPQRKFILMKQKKNCFRDLAQSLQPRAKADTQAADQAADQASAQAVAPANDNAIAYTTALPIFRNYESCMLRILYAIGGNDNMTQTLYDELVKKTPPARYQRNHDACYSEVLNGKGDSEGYGPITDGLVRKQLDDFLICDYVWNDTIGEYTVYFAGEQQYRICRPMNFNDKAEPVSFADECSEYIADKKSC